MELEDIFLGIACRNVNLYSRASESGNFWGYLCTGAKKFGPASYGAQDFGACCKINDTVGVFLEFSDESA